MVKKIRLDLIITLPDEETTVTDIYNKLEAMGIDYDIICEDELD